VGVAKVGRKQTLRTRAAAEKGIPVVNEALRPSDRTARRTRLAARWTTPAGLIVMATLGSAYAYLVDRGAVSDADRAARPSDVFPSFRLDEVRRVRLVHGPDELVLERQGDATSTWTVTSPGRPQKQAADPAAVDVLLRELELARRVRDMKNGQAAGLSNPRVRGQVTVGQLQYEFALGDDAKTPPGAAYMNLEGEGAFVVGSTLAVQLLRGADAYRERGIVPYGAGDVGRLEVRSPGGAFSIERVGTTFRLGGPTGLRASRGAVDRLFGGLAEARADFFVDDADADRACTPPALTVTVTPQKATQPRVRFVVGAQCEGRPHDVMVARMDPTRTSACVAKEATDALGDASAEVLLDRGVFFARADEIEELSLAPASGSGPRVEIARRATGWRERLPEPHDLDADEVESANALVDALANAQALDARPRTDRDRFTARTRATIVRTGAPTTEIVEIAAPDKDGVALARRLDDEAVLRLPWAVARRFDPHPAALRGGLLWPVGFDAASVVAIRDSCGPSPERIDLEGGRWILRTPAGLPVDPIAVSELATAFAQAKPEAWLAENDDGTYGFARPSSCAVSLTLASTAADGPPRVVGMTFGAEDDGGYDARTLDGQAVFVAPEALHDLAARPAIDRSRFRLDPTSLTRVKIVRGADTLALTNAGGHLALALAAGTPLSAERDVAKLAAALAAFEARYALHDGPATRRREGFEHPTIAIDASGRSDAGQPLETHIVIGALVAAGAGGTRHDASSESYFARVSGIDATFAVPREAVDALVAAFASLVLR
jgi:hypothetical protein